MKDLLIGDCHFGIKTNSVFWLNKQIEFFKITVYDIINKEKPDRIIFLGDLTDIRYAINQQVGVELKNLVRELSNKFNNDIIFIAGNHDFYGPLEEFAEYNSYNLLFGEEFTKYHPNIKFITIDPYLDERDGSLFLPWYWTENPEHFDDMLYRYDMKRDVKAIFCHADLTCWPGPRIASIHGNPIYSGHIHYIVEDRLCQLYNVGAAFSFTFNDVNQDRYVYILEDLKVVRKYKNEITPKFIQINNAEIFKDDDNLYQNSYVEIVVTSKNLNKAEYIDRIKFLKCKYVDSNISVHVIDTDYDIDDSAVMSINTNIHKYIEDNIPKNLTSKFISIKNKINK